MLIDAIEYKLCNKCYTWKPLKREHYYFNSKNKTDGFYPYCISCAVSRAKKRQAEQGELALIYRKNHYKNNTSETLKTNKKWREGNKTTVRAIVKNFYKRNPYKSKEYQDKKKKHIINNQEWDDCRQYFNFRCAYCGKTWEQNKRESKKDMHREHIDDLGKNDLSNCVPSCRDCNSNKWKYRFEDWYCEENPIYDKLRHEKIIIWLTNDYKKYIVNIDDES